MAVLMKVNGNPPGQLIDLNAAETYIGRLPGCNVVLDLQGVSRNHAVIRREAQDYFLVDLKSRNKTYLNEREVPPDEPQRLRQDDRIMICDVEMVFYQSLPETTPIGQELVVTDGGDESTIHMLDASRSELLAASVRPEIKLKAIIEITRNLSSALKLEAVAPKTLDSLMDIFPQAERSFLVLLKEAEIEGRPGDSADVPQATAQPTGWPRRADRSARRRRFPTEHQPNDHELGAQPEEGRAEPGRRQ